MEIQSDFTNYAFRLIRGSVVIKALCYKQEGSKVDKVNFFFFFSIYLILPVELGPGVYSASNSNE
jgi:hypothetical protein